MSGVEIAVAASLATSLYTGAKEVELDRQVADQQHLQLQEQSVQLQLQHNERTIANQKRLERVIAAEEVSTGMRGISPQSGSVRALSMENFSNFLADENASELSFASKDLALRRQGQLVDINRDAKIFNAQNKTRKEVAKTAYTYFGIPSNDAVDASKFTKNSGTATGKAVTNFFDRHFKHLDI